MGDIKFILREVMEKENRLIEGMLKEGLIDEVWERNAFSYEKKIMVKAFTYELEMKYRNYYKYLLQQPEAEDLIPSLKNVNAVEMLNEAKNTSRYLWITINPNSSVRLMDFIANVKKAMSKKWIVNKLYVIEQRGENEEDIGKGFHMHALVDKDNYRFSHAFREFQSSFNKFCDTSNIHCFNVSYCFDRDVKKRINYMLGRKKDKAKWLKQDMDIIFRQEYGIPSYYGEKEYFEAIPDPAQKE